MAGSDLLFYGSFFSVVGRLVCLHDPEIYTSMSFMCAGLVDGYRLDLYGPRITLS